MRQAHRALVLALCLSTLIQARSAPLARAEWPHHWLKHSLHRVKPPMQKDPTVETLAQEIDYLEHHIDTFGTVVPKHPDVWGQARLTKHRQEFEREMAKELQGFKDTLQGAIRRSDQAYLGMALALDSAASGTSTTVNTNTALGMISPFPTGDPITRTPPGKPDLTDFATKSISLEPTVHIDQLNRYLNHLQEMRRINEGDDTADSPGYSLNLVRIPVSITPGKMTRKGYGAEITITAEPYLSEELLPITFRNLVINDLIDTLGLGLTKALEDKSLLTKLDEINASEKKAQAAPIPSPKQLVTDNAIDALQKTIPVDDATKEIFQNAIDALQRGENEANPIADAILALKNAAAEGESATNAIQALEKARTPVSEIDFMMELQAHQAYQFKSSLPQIFDSPRLTPGQTLAGSVAEAKNAAFKETSAFEQLARVQSVSRSRTSLLPFPSTQMVDIFGGECLAPIATGAKLAVPAVDGKHIHLLDVEAYLQSELNAAYQFLKSGPCQELWQHCTHTLVEAIRSRRKDRQTEPGVSIGRLEFLGAGTKKPIEIPKPLEFTFSIGSLRADFFQDLAQRVPDSIGTTTASLAWAILVESALLNQRLIEDMAQISTLKGCDCHPGEPGEECMEFFLPSPSPDARAQFNRYVACRWPIQVFALDPATDDQNIADIFSRRREMQLALAVGVAQGNVRANAAMRFMRRLELDMETIALNRTAVGFAHGSDTFGWRFYPRVQSPDTPGTLVAFGQTLLGGPTRDQDLHDRQLEPAMRECVAVVVMPSFVPYVKFESRSNWFCLTHPRKLELTMNEAMKLSRTYQGVRNQLPCVRDSGAYRDGDVGRMSRVIDQLDRKLPLQSMTVQIPFENELGGFEIFNTGVSDLGPEFRGWYGEPGIFVDAKFTCPATADAGIDLSEPNQCKSTCVGTTMFLVGNHFSVHDTKVIAGGKCVPFVLLSRQIMRVTIPPNVQTFKNAQKEEVVDVHAATPYGVTSHLEIPAIRAEEPKKPTSGWNWGDSPAIEATICFGDCKLKTCLSGPAKDLTIVAADKKALMPKKAFLTMRLTAVDAKDTPRVLGDIAKIELTLNAGSATVPSDALRTNINTVINDLTNGLKSVDNAVKIVGAAILEFNVSGSALPPMPSVKLDDPLIITLKGTEGCKNCDSAPAATQQPTIPPATKAADLPTPPSQPQVMLRFPEQPANFQRPVPLQNPRLIRLPQVPVKR